MSYKNIHVKDDGGVRIVTISRTSPLNPLSMETLREIKDAVLNSGNRVVTLTGANKAFSAGADINGFVGLDGAAAFALATEGHDIMNAIAGYPRPVIAAIHGYAFGGGFELALSCDIRISHPKTLFALPEINLGILPGWGGTQRLRHLVGENVAFDIISTGRRFNAEEAKELRIVNRVTENYLDEAVALAKELAKKPRESLKLVKKLVRYQPDDVFEEEKEAFGLVFNHPDMKEGVQAFLEKREPKFLDK